MSVSYDYERLLSVKIDNNLLLENHVKSLSKKTSKKLNYFSRISSCVNFEQRQFEFSYLALKSESSQTSKMELFVKIVNFFTILLLSCVDEMSRSRNLEPASSIFTRNHKE